MIVTDYMVRAEKGHPFSLGSIGIWVRGTDLAQQEFYDALDISWKTHKPAIACEPLMRLNYNAAQTLMDDLWACGIRPTEGAGSAGAMTATQEHLKDIRQIAFALFDDKLKVEEARD